VEDLNGREFGPYRVVSGLGAGGMASVHKAYQATVDRHVALKVLSSLLSDDSQFLVRFRHEAKIVAQLQHPGILQVFDFGEIDGVAYLVMPLVPGGTLAALLKAQRLELPAIVSMVGQICEALDYAHSKGIVHRDIKPSNILIDERGNCLVADFGLARLAEGSSDLTASGALMGTPAYMSPEQAAGQTAGPASDIYALGIILYQMLTGRVPYVADSPAAMVMQQLGGKIPPPRRLNPALTPAIEAVVLKALARAPDDRFSSARRLHAALLAATRRELRRHQGAAGDGHVPGSETVVRSAAFRTRASAAFGIIAETVSARLPVRDAQAAAPRRARRLVPVIAVAVVVVLAIAGGFWTVGKTREQAKADDRVAVPPAAPASEEKLGLETPASPDRSAPASTATVTHASIERPAARRGDRGGALPAPPVGAVTPPPAPSQVVVEALPNSQVYLDDAFRGSTNAQGRLVVVVATAGAHGLRVSLPGRRDFNQNVTTAPGRAVTVRPTQIDAPASLRVHTVPGAEVILDHASRGVVGADGVMLIPNLGVGQHDIRVLAPGRPPFRQTVTVGAGQELVIDAPLGIDHE
jgi:hypothetical protein